MKSINGTLVVDSNIPQRAFSIVSGGLDSTLATYSATKRGLEVVPLFFNWGQKALKEEWNSVCRLSAKLGLTIPVPIYAPIHQWDTSSLTKGDPGVSDPDNFIVYERNLIFISLAASYARTLGGGILVVGFNKQDAGYDTSPSFVDKLNELLEALNSEIGRRRIGLDAPLIELSKTEIIKQLKEADLFDLTYSCYVSNGPCGKCRACRMRAQYS